MTEAQAVEYYALSITDGVTGKEYAYNFAEKPEVEIFPEARFVQFIGTDPDDGTEVIVGLTLDNVLVWDLLAIPREDRGGEPEEGEPEKGVDHHRV